MKRIISILSVSLLFGIPVIDAQSSRQYMKAGDEYFEKMKYDDAIIQFSKAIEFDPDLDKAYIQRAKVYSITGEYEKSISDFERAIVFNEKDHILYYSVGGVYHKIGDNNESLVKLNKALSIKPKYLDAIQLRADVLLEMGRFSQALHDCKNSLKLEKSAKTYYKIGRVYDTLNMTNEAAHAYRLSLVENNDVKETNYALAKVYFAQRNFFKAASAVSYALVLDPAYLEARILESEIYVAELNYVKAKETLSIATTQYPDEPRLYAARGDCYNVLNQMPAAIHDYSKVIQFQSDNVNAYYKRADAYIRMGELPKAREDYETILTLSKYDGEAQRLHDEASAKLYELNRERDKPVVSLMDPFSSPDRHFDIPRGSEIVAVSGLISDASDIKSLYVNSNSVPVSETQLGHEFLTSVNIGESDQITVQVSDVYDNEETVIFKVRWIEVDPPMVQFIAPIGSDNNTLTLDKNQGLYYMEGQIFDESRIKSIYIDSASAGFNPNEINPTFSANVRVENKSQILVSVEDMCGNVTRTYYTLKSEAQDFSSNPMGKTWAVFINNSEYSSFANLGGPSKDVLLMKDALENYQVNHILELKNTTREVLERFFSIELRDLIRSNNVNSVLIWYAGHGKFLNNRGYWIPVDAVRDDEITYYSTDNMKAAMQTYSGNLKHTLVVTDACESGPSFYKGMRSGIKLRDCNDYRATSFKSSQVFSSAGYELAVDDSQFTRTFANSLINNPDECISIESIVLKVTSAVVNRNQQKPQFGKIDGLEDENGTFFFIPKSYE